MTRAEIEAALENAQEMVQQAERWLSQAQAAGDRNQISQAQTDLVGCRASVRDWQKRLAAAGRDGDK